MKMFIILSILIIPSVIYVIILLIKEQKIEKTEFNELSEKNKELKALLTEKNNALKQSPESINNDTPPDETLNSQLDELKEKNEKLERLLADKGQTLEQPRGSFNNELKYLLDHTKIKDIMIKNIATVHIDAPFSEVPKKFKESVIRHLPVIDDNGKLVGLITQRDLYKIKSPRKLMDGAWHYDAEMLNNVILKHVMIKDPFSLKPEDCIGEAVKTMFYSKYGSIPIADNENKLCGIITTHDILNLVCKGVSSCFVAFLVFS